MKTKTEHTPGPWMHLSGGNVTTEAGPHWAAHIVAQCDKEDDAHLIARAWLIPQVIELFRDIHDNHNRYEVHGEQYDCSYCGRKLEQEPDSDDPEECFSDDCMGVKIRTLLAKLEGR